MGWLDDQSGNCMCVAGFTGALQATTNAAYGRQNNVQIFLDQVNCYGGESNLFACGHNPLGVHDCSHYEDAGVICDSPSKVMDVHLMSTFDFVITYLQLKSIQAERVLEGRH